jgi:hypothetical protein
MRFAEIVSESYKRTPVVESKKLGRAFNHLEDLVFFYGSKGTLEALSHLKELATKEGAGSVRMKWDGNPQVYWGRERKNGPLILAGHNGWSRGAKTDNPSDLIDFIANKSGSPVSDEDREQRNLFAKKFAGLYPLFDKATPKDFVGFVYADSLFLDRPDLEDGIYNFCPNPKSKTCYHVKQNSELGNRISKANVMVVGHAYFPTFGMPDNEQEPMSDFSMFNGNSQLIVLGPVYNTKPINVDTESVNKVEKYLAQNAKSVDKFLDSMKGLGDLKDIIYRFVNQTSVKKQLDKLGSPLFFDWLQSSKVSSPKQEKIIQLNDENNNAIDTIFTLVKMIQDVKDNVIDQVEGEQGDIWDTHGEGRVRYADDKKEFGHVKFVPRKRWTPGER